MRLLQSVRARLLAMVAALLAVTLGTVAIISTRVAHVEIRKLEVRRVGNAALPTGTVVVLPEHDELPIPRPTGALDRAFFFIFAGAALFGTLMAVAIARWISVPVERLTEAARRMEGGDLSVRVEPSGGAQLGELARGFNAMAAAVDRNEELRRRMVTDVAHELRTPLTNLRCELESMQDGLTPLNAERIASLHAETLHLAALVDDLQDLSLAQAGRLEIDAHPVNAGDVARRAAGAMAGRGATVALDGPDGLMMRADARRTLQILTNLLTNAIAAGAAHVTIGWELRAGEVVIRVADDGAGIHADDLPHVFERFYRVDASRSRATGGAGLGLSIVRELVVAQGGRVWAESTPGAGSTFSFTLPTASS